jgi:hypothetical protein
MRVDPETERSKLFSMGNERLTKPFLETWLRRTRKQLSGSGRITELALILARDGASLTQEDWILKLQAIFHGNEEPTMELLTQIDSLLAKPAGKVVSVKSEALLF